MIIHQHSALLVILASCLADAVVAHTRLECPPPRSGQTGEKVGPCDAPDDPNLEAYPLIPGALNTITWLESIGHPGAPARFALSFDGEDDGFESCILLDHVPHDEYSQPNFLFPTTYHRSSITLWIPDVFCERCSLQLITVMSDEMHGLPKDNHCTYSGARNAGTVDLETLECEVVYHSCAPVSINGTVPRNEIDQCNTTEFEEILEWPFSHAEQHSTYFYKGNPGIFDQEYSRLLSGGAPVEDCSNFLFCDPEIYYNETFEVPVDAKYAAMEGSCARMVDYEVENFKLGKLPTVLKPGVESLIENNEPIKDDTTSPTDAPIAIGNAVGESLDDSPASKTFATTFFTSSWAIMTSAVFFLLA